MFFRRHRQADGLCASRGERLNVGNPPRAEFSGDCSCAFGVCIHNAHELRTLDFTPHPHVVPAKLADTDNSNPYRFPAHDFLFADGFSAGACVEVFSVANASIAIPASSAARISSSRSNKRVRPASIARAVAFERLMTSIVFSPTTGTSKRISCAGLLTFTTTSLWPLGIRARGS